MLHKNITIKINDKMYNTIMHASTIFIYYEPFFVNVLF